MDSPLYASHEEWGIFGPNVILCAARRVGDFIGDLEIASRMPSVGIFSADERRLHIDEKVRKLISGTAIVWRRRTKTRGDRHLKRGRKA